MSLDLLGEDFDLHGAGRIWRSPTTRTNGPKRSPTAAGSLGAGCTPGWSWPKAGEKMSKSLGNTLSLPELARRATTPGRCAFVLQSHYRRPMMVHDNLRAAETAVERLDTFARDFVRRATATPDAGALGNVSGTAWTTTSTRRTRSPGRSISSRMPWCVRP